MDEPLTTPMGVVRSKWANLLLPFKIDTVMQFFRNFVKSTEPDEKNEQRILRPLFLIDDR